MNNPYRQTAPCLGQDQFTKSKIDEGARSTNLTEDARKAIEAGDNIFPDPDLVDLPTKEGEPELADAKADLDNDDGTPGSG